MSSNGFLETLLQSGVSNTFLKTDFVEGKEESLKEKNVTHAVLGVPFEGCTIYRTGNSFGPQYIRRASEQFSSYNIELDVDINDHLVLADTGDVFIVPGNRDKSHDNIQKATEEICAADSVPILLGGDHSITLPAVKGVLKDFKGKLGIIHIDTHMDTADTYAGEKISNCTQMLRITELEQVSGDNIVQIGIKGCLNPKEFKNLAEERGITTLLLNDVHDRGIDAVVEEAIEIASKGTDGIYLTVDIDVLDPAYAPGTCAPDPGGMTIRELLKAVNRIGKEKIVGFDLVEVAPQYDVNDITSRAAVRVIMEFLGSVAQTKGNQ